MVGKFSNSPDSNSISKVQEFLDADFDSKVRFEYDSDGESDFEGEFKIREEEVLPVTDSKGYMKFKGKSSIKSNDKIKVFDFNKTGENGQLFLNDENSEILSSGSDLVKSERIAQSTSFSDMDDNKLTNVKFK